MSSPRLPTEILVAPEILHILALAQGGVDSETAFENVGLSARALASALDRLLELGFLGSAVESAGPPSVDPPWDAWGPQAWSFHRSTRNVKYLTEPEKIEAQAEKIAERAPPSPPKLLSAPTLIMLPRIWSSLDEVRLKDILEGRRSHRTFKPETIRLDALATVLHFAFAPLRFAECGPMGVLELRSAASAGARHELAAYVLVFDVEGVAPALYHYDQLRHGLVLVKGEVSRERWEEITFRQEFFRTGAFGVVFVSDAHQLSWKYRHARGYRMLMQNVGHAAQVFTMTASALGLGCAITGAFQDNAVEEELGPLSPSEMPTFVVVCGRPVVDVGGGPLDLSLPQRPWDAVRRRRP